MRCTKKMFEEDVWDHFCVCFLDINYLCQVRLVNSISNRILGGDYTLIYLQYLFKNEPEHLNE